MWQAISAVRDLGRLHDIAAVLIRYGFGDLVRRTGLAGVLERTGRALHWHVSDELARLEPPARVRRVLEELGPSFVKLGQILSTRVDLFSPEWITEFSKLQDSAIALPFSELRAQLTEDLGEPPENIFPRLETQALAAASLAQVHRAWLSDGTPVVLKIRRPGIRPLVEADLRLLKRLAEIVESEAPDLRRYRPKEVVRQFTLSLRRELDFSAEGRSAERIAANFEAQYDIVIPRIYWEWTCERLNVQDYIDGIPGRDTAALDASGLDRVLLAQRGSDAVLKMILEDGFFHADLHPGNIYFLPDNQIAFIDFGMVGRISEERRYQIAILLHGLVSHDAEIVSEILLDWSDNTDADSSVLQNEIDAFVDQYHGVQLRKIDIARMLSELLAILRDHGLTLPPDLALLIKAFITLEGLGRQLNPAFDMMKSSSPMIKQAMKAHTAPDALAKRGWRALLDSVSLITSLPKDLSRLLRIARRGKIQLQVELLPLKHFSDKIDRAASRLALSVITAALIIGSAIVHNAESNSSSGLSTLGLLGFIAAASGGVWVLISIWRSGKD
ncbi:MAG: ubiquinone biosynthesis protein UbiB [Tolumonas sp.]|nr:MAG: ubiquinone biosynthesis protein UbiB [Tolumonas sp.]